MSKQELRAYCVPSSAWGGLGLPFLLSIVSEPNAHYLEEEFAFYLTTSLSASSTVVRAIVAQRLKAQTQESDRFGFSSALGCLLAWPVNWTLPGSDSFHKWLLGASNEVKHINSSAWTGHVVSSQPMFVPSYFLPTLTPGSEVLRYLVKGQRGKNLKNIAIQGTG